MFKTIKENVSAEIVEKKSKFIANVFYIESTEEAENIIREMKKKYYDARHNCFAYSVYAEDGIQNRYSDDGEPSGTAGSPMLNIITSRNLSNILVVVTRYFGGILLGTGGLVRAYTGAFQEALNNVVEVNKDLGLEACLIIEYSELEKVKYYFNQNDINIVDIVYDEKIKVIFEVTKEKYDTIIENKENLNFKYSDINIIKSKDRSKSGKTAPAEGLYLVDIKY